MNYHVEHHMYAAVPFYKLGALRKAIEADLPPAYRGLTAAWREIHVLLQRQHADPEYAFYPPVPGSHELINSANKSVNH
jgi:fatty acid desaturase